MASRLITTAEAAQRLGVSERRIRALCQAGRIVGAQLLGRDWVIPDPVTVDPPLDVKHRPKARR